MSSRLAPVDRVDRVAGVDRAVRAGGVPVAEGGPAAGAGQEAPRAGRRRQALYPRLLRLRHVHPSAWQRAVLGEGAVVAGILLVLADLASAWTLVLLPLVVAGLVKSHDLLAGVLTEWEGPEPTD